MKLRIALDCDDVLFSCNGQALKVINEKCGTNYQLDDIKSFFGEDETLAERKKLYHDPEFIGNLPLYPGAREFVRKLLKIADVYIASAVNPECMTARAQQIMREFPEIPFENIILGGAKKLYDIDILLDDGPHNFLSSQARFPVLMRRPWNANISGALVVNNYEDFLHIVDIINNGIGGADLSAGGICCLVGPSGSGKTEITAELTKSEEFTRIKMTTSRPRRDNEPKTKYRFVDDERFADEKAAGKFIETSLYAGNYYGITKEQIETAIQNKKIGVIPMDICGAITLKNIYREKCILVFVDRARQDVILNILKKQCGDEQKTARILSLENEFKNRSFCNFTVRNNGDIKDVAEQIKNAINKASN